jgi:hypothetical protein
VLPKERKEERKDWNKRRSFFVSDFRNRDYMKV